MKSPIKNRRIDAVYFGLLLIVGLIGYTISNRPATEARSIDPRAFALPQFSFEESFELPYKVVKFKSRAAPRLRLHGNMESALHEVRKALLTSSTVVEERPVEHFAAVVE